MAKTIANQMKQQYKQNDKKLWNNDCTIPAKILKKSIRFLGQARNQEFEEVIPKVSLSSSESDDDESSSEDNQFDEIITISSDDEES